MAIYSARGIVPVSADIWALLDGRANAPTGTPQLPTLLNSYSPGGGRHRTGGTVAAAVAAGNFQPPWMVAGVDYRVGINTGVSLVVPNSGNIPPQCSIESYGVAINDTCTFDSFNCDNILVLVWHGNPIITNCSFVGGGFQTRFDTTPLSTGVTLRYCNLDAQDADNAGVSHLKTAATGLCVFEYNIIKNADAVNFQISGVDPSCDYRIRYNLFGSSGVGAPGGAHGDWIQLDGGEWLNVVCDFNTIVSDLDSTVATTQGFSFNSEGGTGTINNGSCSHNTGITRLTIPGGGASTAEFLFMDQQFLANPYFVTENYADLTGTDPAFGFFREGGTTGPFPGGTAVFTRNTDLVTGATLT